MHKKVPSILAIDIFKASTVEAPQIIKIEKILQAPSEILARSIIITALEIPTRKYSCVWLVSQKELVKHFNFYDLWYSAVNERYAWNIFFALHIFTTTVQDSFPIKLSADQNEFINEGDFIAFVNSTSP